MSQQPLFGQRSIRSQYVNDPRTKMMQSLMQQGSSTAPVRSWGEGLARMLTGGVGALADMRLREKNEQRQDAYSDAMMQALAGAEPRELFGPPMLDAQGNVVPMGTSGGGALGMAEAAKATGNKDILPFAMQMQMQGMQEENALNRQNELYERKREDVLTDAEAQRSFQRELFDLQQGAKPKTPFQMWQSAPENKGKGYMDFLDFEQDRTVEANLARAGATIKAKSEQEKIENLPISKEAIQSKIDKMPVLENTINQMKELANSWMTSGLTGQITQGLAGSPQYNMNALADTVKGTIGIQELLAAKEKGATFGALTKSEMDLLISQLGALDTLQDPKQLVPVLDNILVLQQKSLGREIDKFKQNYPNQDIGSGPKIIGSNDEYNALPSGSQFIGPDGQLRIKP